VYFADSVKDNPNNIVVMLNLHRLICSLTQ
jgi:hypothetical protein